MSRLYSGRVTRARAVEIALETERQARKKRVQEEEEEERVRVEKDYLAEYVEILRELERAQEKREEYRQDVLRRLNLDVMMEIFRYYVAKQPDGVFVLTLLSTGWRDRVIRSPTLWQWITINENIADWKAKTELCATLSGAHPLYIVLRLPFVEWRSILPIAGRWLRLFIEIPGDMSFIDATENTSGLLKAIEFPAACQIHWLRAGNGTEEAHESDLNVLPEVKDIYFDCSWGSGASYYYSSQSPDRLETEDANHPVVIHHSLAPFTYSRVSNILQNMPNLQKLSISLHAIDHSFLWGSPVVMHHLSDLQIRGIGHYEYPSIQGFLGSIECPNISSIFLSGRIRHVMDCISRLVSLGRPSHLTLEVTLSDSEIYGSIFVPDCFYDLRSVTSVCMLITVSAWIKNVYPGPISESLNLFKAVTVMHVTVTFTEYLYQYKRPSDFDLVSYSLGVQGLDECPWYPPIESPDNLRLVIPDLNSSLFTLVNGILSALTSLTCPTPFLLCLLAEQIAPALHTIQLPWLNKYQSEEIHQLEDDLIPWIIRHAEIMPPIHTFGIPWFPSRHGLVSMSASLSKSLKKNETMTILLPSYPNREIQKEITGSLRLGRVQKDGKLLPTERVSEDQHIDIDSNRDYRLNDETCFFCWRSIVQCRRDHSQQELYSYCNRHSVTNLVSITENTFVDTS